MVTEPPTETAKIFPAGPAESTNKGRELVTYAAEFVGGAVGGTLGFLFGAAVAGPQGAALGAPAGAAVGGAMSAGTKKIVANVVCDVASRVMSSLEKRRVSIAVCRTAETVRARIEEGETPRQDVDYVEPQLGGRAAAEEIFEGVLLKCKNEYEEKKCRFIENVFVNITFHPEISPHAAISLLSIADRLTYRQLCLLAILGRAKEFHLDPNSVRFQLQSTSHQHMHAMFLKQEIADLDRFGSLDNMRGDGTAYLSRTGLVAFDLFGLKDVPVDDLSALRTELP